MYTHGHPKEARPRKAAVREAVGHCERRRSSQTNQSRPPTKYQIGISTAPDIAKYGEENPRKYRRSGKREKLHVAPKSTVIRGAKVEEAVLRRW